MGCNMNKNLSCALYFFLVIIFCLCTLFEIFDYLSFNSNSFWLVYLIINSFICLNMIIMAFNFKDADYRVRISKNVIISIIGLLASFVLETVIFSMSSYVDESFIYIDSIFISIKIIKPIIYVLLFIFSVMEYKLPVLISRKNL